MITAGEAGAIVAGAAVSAIAAAGLEAERQLLGAPQSVLLVAMAGSLFGAFHARSDALAEMVRGPQPGWRLAAKWTIFAVSVAGWGLVAAWVAMLAWYLHGAPPLLHPIAGLSGVAIRRVLGPLLTVIDSRIDALGGRRP